MIWGEVIFWLAIAALAYAYLAYPLLVAAWGSLRPRAIQRWEHLPPVTVLVTAHNEAKHIADKIENTLALDYPRDRLEIVVASDHSTDGTDDIVRGFAPAGVRLVALPEWRGKTGAQNAAVGQAAGEVVVFSDATAMYRPDVLRNLVRDFGDPGVGCVTGKIAFRDELDASTTQSATVRGVGLRHRYELALRERQSRAGSLFGATGCIYAVRRELCQAIADDLVSDLALPLLLLEQGYRTVYEPEALAVVARKLGWRHEFARRSRVVMQSLWTLWRMRRLLSPLRVGLLGSLAFSHRVLRWLAPVWLLAALGASLALALLGSRFYQVALAVQLVFYLSAAAGFALERRGRRVTALYVPFYFCLVNVAALVGLARSLRGEHGARWEPAAR